MNRTVVQGFVKRKPIEEQAIEQQPIDSLRLLILSTVSQYFAAKRNLPEFFHEGHRREMTKKLDKIYIKYLEPLE